MTARLGRLRDLLEEAQLDALLVSVPVDDPFGRHGENRYWISGFTGTAGVALVTHDRALFAADFRYTEQAETECRPFGFDVFPALGGMKEWWPQLVAEAGLAGVRLGISPSDMSYGGFIGLQARIDDMPADDRPVLAPAPPLIERLRARKDASEIEALQKAIDVADAAFAALTPHLEPDTPERDVATMFESNVVALGGEGPAFATIVAAGPRGAMPHAQPSEAAVGENQGIVIDMGARVNRYCSDLTRTIVLGDPSPKFLEIYEIVFEAQRNAIEHVEAGMTGSDAHALAASVIEAHGYGDRFGHGLGHGVGLQVHEAPYLGTTSEDILENGMVFTIEPGIYLPDWGGIRIEDVVVLEEGRARVLSHAAKLIPAGV